MIRQILTITIFSCVTFVATGQVSISQDLPNYFNESLYLHVISKNSPGLISLRKELENSDEIVISENIVDYPYRSNIHAKNLKNIKNKSTILTLIKRYITNKYYAEAQQLIALLQVSDLPIYQQDSYQFYKGYLYFIHKDFSQALKVFNTAGLSQKRYKYESLYYAAFCNMFSGEYEASLDKFSQLNSKGKYQDDLPYYSALMKYKMGDFKAVITILKNDLDHSNSTYIDAMRELLSRAYYKESKWDKLSDVLLSDNNCCKTPEQHYFVGLSLYKRGMENKALIHLSKSTKMKTEESQNALLAIGAIYAKKDAQLALTIFKEAVEMPYNTELRDQAILATAKVYEQIGEKNKALAMLDRLSTTSKSYETAQMIKYRLLYTMQNFEGALSVWTKIKGNNNDNDVYQELVFRIGLKAHESNDYKKSIHNLKEASSLNSDLQLSARATHLLARIYFDDANNNEGLNTALDRYDIINKMRKSRNVLLDSEIYYLRGYVAIDQQKYSEAISSFQTAKIALLKAYKIRNQPQHEQMYEDILLRKADCYLRMGLKNQAEEHYTLAFDHKVDQGDYALYQKGKIEDLQNEPYLQLATFELLEKEYPNSKYLADAWLKKGNVLVKLNKQKEAYDQFASLYQSTLSNDFQKIQALSYLGLLTYNQGDVETALSFYKKLLERPGVNSDQREEALVAIEEIYLKDLQNSDGYYSFLQKIKSAVHIDKESIEFNLAMDVLKTDKLRGIKRLQKYISDFPNSKNNITALKEIAKAYEATEQHYEAVTAYNKLIEFSPRNKEMGLVRIIHNLSMTDKHVNEYLNYNQKLLEGNFNQKRNDQIYANIAKAAIKTEQAIAYHKHITIALNGKILDTNQKDIIRLALVKEYLVEKKYAASKSHLLVLTQSSNNAIAAESMHLVAQRLMQIGKYKEAHNLAKKSVIKNSSDKAFIARVIFTQAEIYFFSGDLEAASSALQVLKEHRDLAPSFLQESDELTQKILQRRKEINEQNNPTISLQFGTHE
ncbi:MAG: hypothetical protein V3V00_14985 [Saprospiraceae bacterium]